MERGQAEKGSIFPQISRNTGKVMAVCVSVCFAGHQKNPYYSSVLVSVLLWLEKEGHWDLEHLRESLSEVRS